ncbi:uncharacterized protein LOC130864374 [Chionomys nivalis]|uniref:uncharacterized protein LOC130864374 n=1 Tax=Chionomys nivalis TaxID=269649 RepID=UPI0025973F53|nr:uncharacterized protein LOC130864374 [Chionomys nivalis]
MDSNRDSSFFRIMDPDMTLSYTFGLEFTMALVGATLFTNWCSCDLCNKVIASPGAIGAVPLVVPDVACDDRDMESLLQGLWDFSRNSRKTLTTVQGIADDYDKKKLVKAFKKKFACNGTVIEHPEYGEVIQLQGDQRKNICQFLIEIGLAKDDQLKQARNTRNQSSASEFILLGLPIQPEDQDLYSALFLTIYLTTVVGNLLIILLIRLDSHLHTPMYFFLSHLAFTDISFSSVTAPKMLMNMLTHSQSISYAECISQVYFFLFFADLDSFLLTSMAYDRYVAICHPLHYTSIMSQSVCFLLVIASWLLSFAGALVHTILLARLSFFREKSMMKNNQSSTSEFILLGLPIQPEDQDIYSALFLIMYLTTVLGNLLIILLIRLDSHLHTPMYFFLSHLAFTDISFSSVTAPKMLMNMLTHSQSISYVGCVSQVCFFLLFGCVDNFLLTSMAYDRYVAICHPLHYTTIMRQSLCVLLVIVSWVFSSTNGLVHTLLFARLSLFRDNTVHHFFCDLSALIKLSNSDTSINELLILTLAVIVITVPFICILISYGHIGATILRTPSTKGICKALSTCGSHLCVVSLYYGAIIGLYFFPSSNNTNDKDIIVAVMYTVVTPMLNPFIYSLRNRDMKGALRNILNRRVCSQ